ncbi:MAG: ABC transporter permease [Nocardioides sp.]|nr:ABC transporter permease [Nocardioides sp.]
MTGDLGLPLALALVALLLIAILASWRGGLQLERILAVAAVRAVVQLAAVSLLIAAVLGSLVWSACFAVLMFGVAVLTSSRRVDAVGSWPWIAVAMGCGVVPVLTLILASGAVPFAGASVVPIAGIVIGGAMTAHTLAGRAAFKALHEERSSYEAALSIGLVAPDAVSEVVARHLPESLVPVIDQTRTVGLVTLPGAFVGVLLGGGTALQAGSAQILVLVGLLAAETLTVTVAHRLIRHRLLLPAGLRAGLPT